MKRKPSSQGRRSTTTMVQLLRNAWRRATPAERVRLTAVITRINAEIAKPTAPEKLRADLEKIDAHFAQVRLKKARVPMVARPRALLKKRALADAKEGRA